jgi:hypothetical protein
MEGPDRREYSTVASDADPIIHFANYLGSDLFVTLTSSTTEGWGADLHIVNGADSGSAEPGFELNADLTPAELELLARWLQRQRHAGTYPYAPGKIIGLGKEDARRRVVMDSKKKSFPASGSGPLWLGDALRVLHEDGYTIVGDYFTKPFRLDRPTPHPELGAFLESVAVTFGRDVRVNGKTLVFESTTWVDDEPAEPDAALVDSWVDEKTKRGVLAPASWLGLGRLPRAQLAALCLISELWGTSLLDEAHEALRGKPAFDLFHHLRPEQRAKAADTFIDWQDLDIRQRQFALAWGRRYEGARVTPRSLAHQFRVVLRSESPVRPEEVPVGKAVSLASLSIRLPQGGRSAVYRVRGRQPARAPAAAP